MRLPTPTINCPACGAVMPNETRAKRPWVCLSCSGQFTIPIWYQNLVFWGAPCLTFVLCYVFGLRGLRLFVSAIVVSFPAIPLCIFMLDRIWVPSLVVYRPNDSSPKDSGSNLFGG